MPFDLQSKNFRLNCFSEHFLRSTANDTGVKTFVACTTAAIFPYHGARCLNPMNTRTRNALVTFNHPFELKGVDRILPPGEYRVVTDEQLIEALSFPVYRRILTMIFVPGESGDASIEMVTIDPHDLQAAQDRDKTVRHESSPATP
jgi:hypothetical protein